MGFYKRWVTKEGILKNVDDIYSYLDSDALIFDDWSYRFVEDLNPEERKLRNKIKSELSLLSGCPDKHPDYNLIQSLSESLLSLMTNPDWLDIHFVKTKLGLKTSFDEGGDIEKQKNKCISAIIEYYERS